MAMNGLYVPRDATWWPELRSELLSFPAGKHDDQVDALGLIGQLLAGEPMFTHPEEEFVCEPITIPSTWPRIAAVDLDRNRFGAIWAAWDRRNDIVERVLNCQPGLELAKLLDLGVLDIQRRIRVMSERGSLEVGLRRRAQMPASGRSSDSRRRPRPRSTLRIDQKSALKAAASRFPTCWPT
jgi:hypothetical protein